MNPNNAARHYKSVSSQTSVIDADPHRLIQILMENALEKMALAKGFMERNNIHDKGINISLALSIIEALQTSLDKEQGGEIANNLYDLYAYMLNALLEANLQNDINKIDEVINVLSTIKEGWDKVPAQLKKNEGND